MKFERLYPNKHEAVAFASGLSEASDGNVHSIDVRPAHGPPGIRYRVTWEDESRKPVPVPEPNPPLTTTSYAGPHEGKLCPVCRTVGHSIESDSVKVTAPDSVEIQCGCQNPDCEATWTNIYELSGYEELKR